MNYCLSKNYKLEFPDYKISIVMPVYNAEQYIRECIDSVLQQTLKDFEFIIIDDGSVDNTVDIIESYNDDRIILIKKEHSGIVRSLNWGINVANGKYIARMDADDIMLPERLQVQYDFLENHQEYDLVSNGLVCFGDIDESFKYGPKEITLQEELLGNKICHPCCMFRKGSLKKLPFLYEEIFQSEDYKLWLTMLTHGLRIYSNPEILLKYRVHKNNLSASINSNTDKLLLKAYTKKNNNNAKLTVVLPVYNDGIELEKTVTCIRATANNVNIIIMDDHSPNSYNYKQIANIFGCEYYYNSKNLGAAQNKMLGVSKVKTPYFVFFDSHMRIYEQNWDDRIVKLLERCPNSIITSFSVDIQGTDAIDYPYKNEKLNRKIDNYSAGVNFSNTFFLNSDDKKIAESSWNLYGELPKLEDEVYFTPSVLGAFYATSVVWWNHIRGYLGLMNFGSEEPLISIKTWLAGGQVLFIKDLYTGHLYKDKAEDYQHFDTPERIYNKIFILNLFFEGERLEKELDCLRKNCKSYNAALQLFEKFYPDFLKMRDDFWNRVAIHDIDYFLEFNKRINDKYVNYGIEKL